MVTGCHGETQHKVPELNREYEFKSIKYFLPPLAYLLKPMKGYAACSVNYEIKWKPYFIGVVPMVPFR